MGYVDEKDLEGTEAKDWEEKIEEEQFEADKKPEVPRHVKYVTMVSQFAMYGCKILFCLSGGLFSGIQLKERDEIFKLVFKAQKKAK